MLLKVGVITIDLLFQVKFSGFLIVKYSKNCGNGLNVDITINTADGLKRNILNPMVQEIGSLVIKKL